MCPKGYEPNSSNGLTCVESSPGADTWSVTFNLISRNWTNDSVTWNGGLTSSNEDTKDPLSYHKRGIYFDGTAKFMTLASKSEFRLHAFLTIDSWILP
jgi:hypothetical protein